MANLMIASIPDPSALASQVDGGRGKPVLAQHLTPHPRVCFTVLPGRVILPRFPVSGILDMDRHGCLKGFVLFSKGIKNKRLHLFLCVEIFCLHACLCAMCVCVCVLGA